MEARKSGLTDAAGVLDPVPASAAVVALDVVVEDGAGRVAGPGVRDLCADEVAHALRLLLVVEGSEEATTTERGRKDSLRINNLRGRPCREH